MNPHYTINNNLESKLLAALSEQEKKSIHYLQALLLLPSWRYPFDTQDNLFEERDRLRHRTEAFTKHLDLIRLEKPNTWPEESQLDNLLSLISLVRLQELSDNDFIASFLGSVQLSLIDAGGYDDILTHLDELEWELEIESDALQNFIEDTKASIAVFHEGIDWAQGSQEIQKRIESQLYSQFRWQQWLRLAGSSIKKFFEEQLSQNTAVAFASSSTVFSKPLPCHKIWREGQQELSLTYFAEQFYIQFYGAQKPILFLDGQEVEACLLPTSLQSDNLCWWPLSNDFAQEIVLQWSENDKKKTFFLGEQPHRFTL